MIDHERQIDIHRLIERLDVKPCSTAWDWIRSADHMNMTLREFWEACPNSGWLDVIIAAAFAKLPADVEARYDALGDVALDHAEAPADTFRKAVPWERVADMITLAINNRSD